jgi:predicted acyl esterase
VRRLTFAAPLADEEPDRFEYDPGRPVGSLNPLIQQPPTDQRPVEDRVLAYTSEPLMDDLHVVGPLKAVLYAASSAPDTDWVVRLCDVWPDGRSLSVRDREQCLVPVTSPLFPVTCAA